MILDRIEQLEAEVGRLQNELESSKEKCRAVNVLQDEVLQKDMCLRRLQMQLEEAVMARDDRVEGQEQSRGDTVSIDEFNKVKEAHDAALKRLENVVTQSNRMENVWQELEEFDKVKMERDEALKKLKGAEEIVEMHSNHIVMETSWRDKMAKAAREHDGIVSIDEYENVKMSLDGAMKQLSEMEAEKTKLESDLRQKNSVLSEKNAAVELKLQQAMADLRRSQHLVDEAQDRSVTELELAQHENTWRQKNRVLTEKCREFETQIASKENEWREEKDDLLKQCTSLQRRLKELSSQDNVWRKRNRVLNEQRVEALQQLANVEDRVGRSHAEVLRLNRLLDETKAQSSAELQCAHTALQQLHSDFVACHMHRESLQRQLEQVQQHFRQQQQHLRQKDSCNQQLQETQRKMEPLLQEREQLLEEMTVAKTAVSTLALQVSSTFLFVLVVPMRMVSSL